jgi:transcription initiation factor TFIID TATA-box-binding protein
MTEPRVVLLIFSSGKMVITGAKSEEEVNEVVYKVYNILDQYGCLKPPAKIEDLYKQL